MKAQSARTHIVTLALAMVVPLVVFASLVASRYVSAERERIEMGALDKARQLEQRARTEIDRVTVALQTLASCECFRDNRLDDFWPQASSAASRMRMTINLMPVSELVAPPPPGNGRILRIDTTDRDPAIRVTVPTLADGQVSYLLTGTISGRVLNDIVRTFDIPENWVALLMDPEGLVVARSVDAETLPHSLAQSLPPAIRAEGIRYRDLGTGGPILLAVDSADGEGLGAVIAVPAATLEQPLARATGILAILGGAALLLALILAYIIGERLARSIKALARVADSAKHGEQIGPVETPIREINDVSTALSAAVNARNQRLRERNLAFNRLAMQEAQLRSVLETAPVAAIIIDEDGTILSFSAAAVKLFGYGKREAIGSNVSMLMPSPDRDTHNGHLAEFLRAAPQRSLRHPRIVTALDKSGERFPVEIAVGVAHVGGRYLFTGFMRDLREQQRIEQELHHAQRMEALGQLTGGIAHDFNNLLTVITGNLEMMENKLGSRAQCQPLLAEAQEAADLSARLVARLLAFGRRQALNPVVFDAGVMVLDLCGILRRTLGETIELDTTGIETGLGTRADIAQLQSALINLAVNARDAMPLGGKLFIAVTGSRIEGDLFPGSELKPGDYVMIALTDTGTGMPVDVERRAFEPFFTTKEAGMGTGLGLSMVYGFAKQSQGDVALESRPGEGTTVRLYLPREALPTALERPALKIVPPGTSAGTILLVEDDHRVRRITAMRLRDLGYLVIEAANGPAAVRAAAANPDFDLLFTDFVMPGGMNGDDLARSISKRHPRARVLFTSGYSEPAIVHMQLREGVGWLRKPYTIQQLADAVRDAIEKRPTARRIRAPRAR